MAIRHKNALSSDCNRNVVSLPLIAPLQMFLSIAFAAVGVAGALYSFGVAVAGLNDGPLCKVLLVWSTPFKNG